MKSIGNREVSNLVLGLTDDAIESGLREDRLLALSTANSVDSKHGTKYGRMVLNKLVTNAGYSFETAAEGESHMMATETTQIGVVMVQVAKAMQPDLKANLRIAELVDNESDATYVHIDENGEGLVRNAPILGVEYPNGDIIVFSPSEDRPFVISLNGSKTDLENFSLAVRSVLIGPEPDVNPHPC